MVSVRLGCRKPPWDKEFANLAGTSKWRLHIEDPYQLGRNLHCSIATSSEDALHRAFCLESAREPMGRPFPRLMPGAASSDYVLPCTLALGLSHIMPTQQVAMPIHYDSSDVRDEAVRGRIASDASFPPGHPAGFWFTTPATMKSTWTLHVWNFKLSTVEKQAAIFNRYFRVADLQDNNVF